MTFSSEQIKALSAKLSAQHVKVREDDVGRLLSYLEGWHVIAEANRVFGYDGWDRETVMAECVWKGVRSGRDVCGYVARVRIRVRAGEMVVCREGCGAGHGIATTPGEAHESAIKEAETDATKRALATFGNPFGLALYDKERRGVRRSIDRKSETPSRGIDPVRTKWTVFSANNGELCSYNDPIACCRQVRGTMESLGSAQELTAFWSNNLPTLQEMKNRAPNLKSTRGAHYSDLLAVLYEQQLKKVDHDGQAAELNSANTDGHSDPAHLSFAPNRRVRDKVHLQYVASLPCLICGRRPSHAHHVRFAQPRAMSMKVSDEFVVPLCATHHRSLHDGGNEQRWWEANKIDPIKEAALLWQKTRRLPHSANGVAVLGHAPEPEDSRGPST